MSEVALRMGRDFSWRHPWGEAKKIEKEDRVIARERWDTSFFRDNARERANHVSCAEAAKI